MSERKLATIRRIEAIDPIPGADAIDVATVGGWKVVVKKGQFSVGDLAIYLEIDSWVPVEVADFLFKGRTFNGVKGERLRTVKLKGQISQGLLLPVDHITLSDASGDRQEKHYFITGFRGRPGDGFNGPEDNPATCFDPIGYMVPVTEGQDITEDLCIQKFEVAIPAQLAGKVRGNFPSFLRKTDQERIQNLKKELREWAAAETEWEVTEKLDGSSMTMYRNAERFGVCSRNLDLFETDDNAFWKVARELDLPLNLEEMYAVQGELVGPGVQGNPYNLATLQFFCFDVWQMPLYGEGEGRYLTPEERLKFCKDYGIPHVPVLLQYKMMPDCTVDHLLHMAEGKSIVGVKKPQREGIVFKSLDGKQSFKAISNKWLLSNDG